MFLRFVLATRVDGMNARVGIINGAAQVRDNPATPELLREMLQARLDWFDENLDAPQRFSRRRSKGGDPEETRGLSWFRASAQEAVGEAYALAAVLEMCGHDVDVLRTERPGYILFEDDWQVVADPFAETPV